MRDPVSPPSELTARQLQTAENDALAAGTHVPAVDDFGNQYLAHAAPQADAGTLLDKLARMNHGHGYVDSAHVYYTGVGIHGESRHERHDFAVCPDELCVAARAALAASSPATAGLDVERLAEAMHLVGVCHDQHAPGATAHGLDWPAKVAAQYERLAETP